MKRTKPIIALLLSAGLCIGICSCTLMNAETEPQPVPQKTEAPKAVQVFQETETEEKPDLNEVSKKSAAPSKVVFSEEDCLSIGLNSLPESLCPLLAESEAELVLSSLTSPYLIMVDRNGNLISSGTKGETTVYDGTEYIYYSIADYTIDGNSVVFQLDDDVYFSDGVNMTADDVIFTLYILSDPSYDGRYSLADVPISGLEEYRGNLCPKWKVILHDLSDKGRKAKSDLYTKEEKENFLKAFDRAGMQFTDNIISAAVTHFGAEYSRFVLGCSEEELLESPGYQVAFAEYFWDFAPGIDADSGKWIDSAGKKWNLQDNPPTTESFWEMICLRHSYDISDEGINYEMAGNTSFSELLFNELETNCPDLYLSVGTANSENVSGIEKLNMYSVRITFTEPAELWLSRLIVPVCSLHSLGNRLSFRYTDNRFGFEKGDVRFLKENGVCAVSAGAFYPEKIDDKGLSLVANGNFYRGSPLLSGIVLTTEENADISEYSVAENKRKYDICTDYSVCIGIRAAVGTTEENEAEGNILLRNAIRIILEGYAEAELDENGELILSEKAYSMGVRAVQEISEVYNAEGRSLPEVTARLFGEDLEEKIISATASFLNEYGIPTHLEEQTSRESLENYIKEGMADIFSFKVYRLADVGLRQFTSDNEDNVLGFTNEDFDAAVLNENWAEAGILLNDSSVLIELWKKTNSVFTGPAVRDGCLPQCMTEYYSWLSEPEKYSK